MIGLLCFVLAVLASPFKSKLRLEAENAVLRHQLIVLRRRLHGRVRLTNNDRWFFIQLYRWFPSILQVLTIIRPETLVRWHRAGFRCYWRWKSRPLGGRPQIDTELRALIRRMSMENPLWGAPRIHGELLKLGFEVAQSSVAKYMVKRRGPPSQGWRTFLRNHAPDIAAMDLFVVPTIGFDLLYAFVIVRLDRRDLVWINVTANPTAEWVARQITEAFPWDEAPHYLIRDRDRIYGSVVTRRLRAMGIRDKPTAPASPWQNGFAERLIGSIRRECVDHIIVLGEVHLRRILKSYAAITTTSERIDPWTKMRRSLAKFSESEASNHTPSSADFTTTTPELKFSVHTTTGIPLLWRGDRGASDLRMPPQMKRARPNGGPVPSILPSSSSATAAQPTSPVHAISASAAISSTCAARFESSSSNSVMRRSATFRSDRISATFRARPAHSHSLAVNSDKFSAELVRKMNGKSSLIFRASNLKLPPSATTSNNSSISSGSNGLLSQAAIA